MNRVTRALLVSLCILVATGCATRPAGSAPANKKKPVPPVAMRPAAPPPGEGKETAPSTATPPAIPIPPDTEIEVTTVVTFEEPNAVKLCGTNGGDGLGLHWSVVDGAGRYAGITRPSGPDTWTSNTLELPVGIDVRANLEVSGEFRIAGCDGFHVIGLRAPADSAASRFCMYYCGSPVRGQYAIQTRWMRMKTVTEGEGKIPAFGDEKDAFHKMRMMLDRKKKEISYYVDDVPLGTVHYEGEIEPVESVGMDIETPIGGTKLDIRYDNLKVRSFGPIWE